MPLVDLPNGTPTFQGEVYLLGWSENNRDGMTVRLALDATDESGHPFKGLGTGKHGQRFMAVIVPVTDDPAPLWQGDGGHPETSSSGGVGSGSMEPEAQAPKFHEKRRSQQAGALCADPRFQAFMGADNQADAAVLVRQHCGVESRADLDENERAACKWSLLVENYHTEQQYGDMVR